MNESIEYWDVDNEDDGSLQANYNRITRPIFDLFNGSSFSVPFDSAKPVVCNTGVFHSRVSCGTGTESSRVFSEQDT